MTRDLSLVDISESPERILSLINPSDPSVDVNRKRGLSGPHSNADTVVCSQS